MRLLGLRTLFRANSRAGAQRLNQTAGASLSSFPEPPQGPAPQLRNHPGATSNNFAAPLICRTCKKTNVQLTPPLVNRHCSKCLEVYHCGRDCQKADWRAHRRVCDALKSLATESFSSESEDERTGASREKTSLYTGKKPTREERRACKRADLLFEYMPGQEEMFRSMGFGQAMGEMGDDYDPHQDEDLLGQYRGKEDFEDFFTRRSNVYDALNGDRI